MYSKEDTICAISTPPGKGAIAVIRVSGPEALAITGKIISLSAEKGSIIDQPANTIHYATLYDGPQVFDHVVISLFRAPHSYSGEDIVEISCHGSLYIQQRILELLVQAGARTATAGEFTMRAFLNGKLDLTQVEAIADLIASGSKAAHRVAINQMRGGFTREIKKLRGKLLDFTTLVELELDFSEEDVEFANREQLRQLVEEILKILNTLSDSFTLGNVIKQGIPVAIVGKTNAGKSTLLNLLLREEKAIVSEIEGTTRDSIEDLISIRGVHFRLIDTAGLRNTSNIIEKLGIERTWQKINEASVIIQVLDTTSHPEEITSLTHQIRAVPEANQKHRIVVLNKIDKVSEPRMEQIINALKLQLAPGEILIPLSAKAGINLEKLEEALLNFAGTSIVDDNAVIVTNVRHYEALEKAFTAIERVANGLKAGIPGDLLAQDIREALYCLGEITGEISNNELLGNIFKNFCIGK